MVSTYSKSQIQNLVATKTIATSSDHIRPGVSVITAVKNRSDNLETSLATWVQLEEIDEIIIVDWSSDELVEPIIDKFQNGKVFLFKAPNQAEWRPSHSRNLAARLTSFDKILKLDADAMLEKDFFKKHPLSAGHFYYSYWQTVENPNQFHLFGNFYSYRSDFFSINGFNEYVKCYGWEDTDFYNRLEEVGLKSLDFNKSCIYHIPHEYKHLRSEQFQIISDKALVNLKTFTNRTLVDKYYGWGNEDRMLDFKLQKIDDHKYICEQIGADTNVIKDSLLKESEKIALRNLLLSHKLHKIPNIVPKDIYGLNNDELIDLLNITSYKPTPSIDTSFSVFIPVYSVIEFEELTVFLKTLYRHLRISNDVHVLFDAAVEIGKNELIEYYLKKLRITYTYAAESITFGSLLQKAEDTAKGDLVIISEWNTFLIDPNLSELQLLKKEPVLLALSAYIDGDTDVSFIPNNPQITALFESNIWLFAKSHLPKGPFPFAVNQENSTRFLHALYLSTPLNLYNPSYSLKTGKYFSKEDANGKKVAQKKIETLSIDVFNKDPEKVGLIWCTMQDVLEARDQTYYPTTSIVYLEIDEPINKTNLEQLLIIAQRNFKNIWIWDRQKNKGITDWINKAGTSINKLSYPLQTSGLIAYKTNQGIEDFLSKQEGVDVYLKTSRLEDLINNKTLNRTLVQNKGEFPKISIITPAFNAGETLVKAIESVLAQNYPNVEHIIMDGGSTDNTKEILASYPHLIWVSEPDKGQSDAMNKGFTKSTGDIISYLNADDYYLPNAFNWVVPYFKEGAQFVLGNVAVLFEEGHVWNNKPKNTHQKLLRHWSNQAFCVNPVGYFYTRAVQEKTGPYRMDNHLTMDLEFLLKASYDFNPIKTNRTLGVFRNYADTKTMTSYGQKEHWSEKTFQYITPFIDKLAPEHQTAYLAERQYFYGNKTKFNSMLAAVTQTKDLDKIPDYEVNSYIRQSIKCVSEDAPNLEHDKLVVICTIKNDLLLLERFIQHYLDKVKVDRLLFIDFDSGDGTIGYLKSLNEKRISILSTTLPIRVYNDPFKNYALRFLAKDKWTIICSAEECIEFPLREFISTNSFLDYLDKTNVNVVYGHALDKLPSPEEKLTTSSFDHYNVEYLNRGSLTEELGNEVVMTGALDSYSQGFLAQVVGVNNRNLTKPILFKAGQQVALDYKGTLSKGTVADIAVPIYTYELAKYLNIHSNEHIQKMQNVRVKDFDFFTQLEGLSLTDTLQQHATHIAPFEGTVDLVKKGFLKIPKQYIAHILSCLDKTSSDYAASIAEINSLSFFLPDERTFNQHISVSDDNVVIEKNGKELANNTIPTNANLPAITKQQQLVATNKEVERFRQEVYGSMSWKIGNSVVKMIVLLFGWLPFVKNKLPKQ